MIVLSQKIPIVQGNEELKSLKHLSQWKSSKPKSWSAKYRQEPEYLPADFVPGCYDVVCGRGKEPLAHIGNRRFKITISMFLDRYVATGPSKKAKSEIVSQIVELMQGLGMFVKRDFKVDRWFQVTPLLMRERISQTIRDELHQQKRQATYRSSKQSRREKSRRDRAPLGGRWMTKELEGLSFLDHDDSSGILDTILLDANACSVNAEVSSILRCVSPEIAPKISAA